MSDLEKISLSDLFVSNTRFSQKRFYLTDRRAREILYRRAIFDDFWLVSNQTVGNHG
jgi:hypothetical protein